MAPRLTVVPTAPTVLKGTAPLLATARTVATALPLVATAPLPQPVDQLLAAVLLRAVRQQACELAAGPEEAWGPLSVHAQLRLAVVGGV